MRGVQCNELFGGIAPKNHAFSFFHLGFASDSHLTINAHVSNIARACYFELRRLASIRRFLTSTATATLVSAFALSKIDYCSSLLFCSTHDVTCNGYRTMQLE